MTKSPEPRKIRDEIIRDAVTEVFLLRVAAKVGEWQHCYRRDARQRHAGFSCGAIDAEVRGALADTFWTITIVTTATASPANDNALTLRYLRDPCVLCGAATAPFISARYTRTGSAMFLNLCSPRSSKLSGSLFLMFSWTVREMQSHPGLRGSPTGPRRSPRPRISARLRPSRRPDSRPMRTHIVAGARLAFSSLIQLDIDGAVDRLDHAGELASTLSPAELTKRP